MQNCKAAGGDRIVGELVKKGGKTTVDWLSELIQGVWRAGRVPQEWKDSPLFPFTIRRTGRGAPPTGEYQCSAYLESSTD